VSFRICTRRAGRNRGELHKTELGKTEMLPDRAANELGMLQTIVVVPTDRSPLLYLGLQQLKDTVGGWPEQRKGHAQRRNVLTSRTLTYASRRSNTCERSLRFRDQLSTSLVLALSTSRERRLLRSMDSGRRKGIRIQANLNCGGKSDRYIDWSTCSTKMFDHMHQSCLVMERTGGKAYLPANMRPREHAFLLGPGTAQRVVGLRKCACNKAVAHDIRGASMSSGCLGKAATHSAWPAGLHGPAPGPRGLSACQRGPSLERVLRYIPVVEIR
jgi:hypothetical protein